MRVAIDGESASGKGTIARRIAEHFGWDYLDTGKMYRALAQLCLSRQVNLDDSAAVCGTIPHLTMEACRQPGLSTEALGEAASRLSCHKEVRAQIVAWQQRLAHSCPHMVMDGRDIGTVVMPEAECKFFMIASLDARAERRWKELGGESLSLDEVRAQLHARDLRDKSRAHSPLLPAPDARIIDTSRLTPDEVWNEVRHHIEKRL